MGSSRCLFIEHLTVIKSVNLVLISILLEESYAVCNGQIFQTVAAL